MRRPKGPARRRDGWITAAYKGLWVLWRRWKWLGVSLPLIKRAGPGPWLSLDSFSYPERCSVKRPDLSKSDSDLGAFGIPVSKLLGKLDRLNDLLTCGTWEDLAPKGQRALMVFIDGATVRVLVKVEHPCIKLSAVGRSLDEALVALDALLGASDTPWEADIPRQQTGRRKGK